MQEFTLISALLFVLAMAGGAVTAAGPGKTCHADGMLAWVDPC
ncbi:MAG: hypothetical protein N2422_02090 [Rhodobacteraceae bacterium]|nr:hypothetical protein [Paracoccaceae bacterium]